MHHTVAHTGWEMLKSTGRGAKNFAHAAVHPHQTYSAGKEMAHHGWEKVVHGTDRILHRPQSAQSIRSTESAIDICECSRRVQGHLAMQYPEFH